MSNRPTGKPTIGEVAERAKVAASTVSRVVNRGSASAKVRDRVERAIRELGYTPYAPARNLRMGRTGIIGVVSKTSHGAWFNQVLNGVEEALIGKQTSVLLASIALKGTYDLTPVEAWIRDRQVDALIFAHPGKPEMPLIEASAAANLPMAFVAPDAGYPTGHSFNGENKLAGHAVAEYLCNLGHVRFAFAGGPELSQDTQNRLAGLVQGLKERGLELPLDRISFAPNYQAEGGNTAAEVWLGLPRAVAPTAVVAGNDLMGMAFMRRVQQAGVRIPDDVSVVGFDGLPEAGLCWPGLTTVTQPASQMGIDAAIAVLKQLSDPKSEQQTSQQYPMQLLTRESAGPAPKG
jgi:LacI family transcriptional regulator